ncbi:helix-turn-helix domain-containing protein [Cytobacillus gottheilii]|uniref:helix-turn-helix domain-containing protein n=1 Tax=Cytobacillus gottheilii TaxID=859144 RepID=UPI000836ABF0|nr:helix-turn-helix domain-containing protein [Cytobacillus gottheilii]
MNFIVIGEKIKELRKQLKLSQKELADGICTQAQISKIEKGDVYPYASTLYLISQKLGVDVNYFFDIGTTPRIDYVREVSRQLITARRELKYEEMQLIVKAEEKNPLFHQNRKNAQLLLWHKGIYTYHLDNKVNTALKYLDEAIEMTHDKVWSEREVEILQSKGIILFEQGDLPKALEIYEYAKEHLKQLPYIQDDTIQTRLYYNLARTLTRLGQYRQSTLYCKQAIAYCIERDHLYLLGELHYHVGYNFELIGNLKEAKSFMERALIIFELQLDTKYIQFITEKIKNW